MAKLLTGQTSKHTSSQRVFATLAFLAASVVSANASTIYGGFEDTVGGDYDYNDFVFSLSAPSLTLISTGTYYSKPVLATGTNTGQIGTPFWNNVSFDSSNNDHRYNVGYCIYGGGACNNGTGLDPTAKYLAATNLTTTGSANDVTFSVGSGSVSANVTLTITAASDFLGWYNVSTPGTVNYFSSNGNQTGTFTFTPTGNFGLVGKMGSNGNVYYSNTAVTQNTPDNVSHFAFFADTVATPEPGTWALFGSALGGIALFRRRLVAKVRGVA